MEIILIVEDKKEELERAKQVVQKKGAKAVIAENLFEAKQLISKLQKVISGIITDLHFPENKKDDINNPCGLAIVTIALRLNLPIVVCSDINHHHTLYVKSVIEDLEQLTGVHVPFIMDSKDWEEAYKKLQTIKEKQDENTYRGRK